MFKVQNTENNSFHLQKSVINERDQRKDEPDFLLLFKVS